MHDKPTEEFTKKSTYVVEVLYRENSTWQGSVTWNEGRQKLAFRSELELIKLLDTSEME